MISWRLYLRVIFKSEGKNATEVHAFRLALAASSRRVIPGLIFRCTNKSASLQRTGSISLVSVYSYDAVPAASLQWKLTPKTITDRVTSSRTFYQISKPHTFPSNYHIPIQTQTTMSADKSPPSLAATEEDIQLLLAAQCHLGAKNCDKTMLPYIWKRRADGQWLRARSIARFVKLRNGNSIADMDRARYPRHQYR